MRKNDFCLLSISLADNVQKNHQAFLNAFPFGDIELIRLKNIKNNTSCNNSISSLLCLRDTLISLGVDVEAENLTIEREAGGKPYFASFPLYFNITHSQNVCAVAVSDLPVGIDLEFIDVSRDVQSISKRFFSASEHSILCNATDPYDYFFSVWTKKEARAKFSGKGLAAVWSDQNLDRSDVIFKNYRLTFEQRTAWLSICTKNKNINVQINNRCTDFSIRETL